MIIEEFDSLDFETKNQLLDWFRLVPDGMPFSKFLEDYKVVDGEIKPVETSDHVVIYNGSLDWVEKPRKAVEIMYPNPSDFATGKDYNDFVEATKKDAFNFPNTKEEHVSGKDRYCEGAVETIIYIESMMKAWEKNGVPADVAYNLGQVLRYLSSRLGVKDDVKVELGKAHNYLYRAINGKWFED